jgi:hypothetical protein
LATKSIYHFWEAEYHATTLVAGRPNMLFSRFFVVILLALVAFNPLSAFADQAGSYVIDPQRILHANTTKKINRVLSEAAKSRDIHVSIFVFNNEEPNSLDTLAQNKLVQWKSHHPEIQSKRKVLYLFINAPLKESRIITGDNLPLNDALFTGLSNIQGKIIQSALAKNNVDDAAWEAVVASVMVMEDWTAPSGISWFEENLLSPLKWGGGILLVVGLFFGLHRYFHTPHWEDHPRAMPDEFNWEHLS